MKLTDIIAELEEMAARACGTEECSVLLSARNALWRECGVRYCWQAAAKGTDGP